MKPSYAYLFKLQSILWLAFALASCTHKPGYWKNDQISSGKRSDFHQFNTQALKYLKADDLKGLKNMMSQELIENTYTERQVQLMSNHLSDNDYIMLDEYYVINKYNDVDTVPAVGNDINTYSLVYNPPVQDMYFVFFEPKKGENKDMISLIYAKLDYGWKLTKMDLSPYTINGKTGAELYKLAKEQYDKGYLINAINNASLAVTCLKPSEVWTYPIDSAARELYSKAINQANDKYKFPFAIAQVPSKPMIIRVFTEKTDEGTFPAIYYLTHINLKDTAAVKKENILIRNVIGKVMPGINVDNKYVYYSAFNEKPTAKKFVEHFDMTDKLP